MRKFLIALILVLVILFLGASCSNKASQEPLKTSEVSIKSSLFNPQGITVDKGTAVTWTNLDAITHQIKGDNPALPEFTSGIIEPKDSFIFTFETSGTFDYHCNIHPSMTGKVVVK